MHLPSRYVYVLDAMSGAELDLEILGGFGECVNIGQGQVCECTMIT